ncbi:MAG TPA: SH3 domain-containing protein, partial [Pirellulales bacterium]|nr:SH3 domain-containing protein [Pirellulales bacterium]
YVDAANVYVRSGPGENYYPVLRLARGRKVEVYRHDPGGWFAIRPPEDCFSWVSGEFIEPVAESLGRVTGERVVARVGSKFSDIRDVIQVRLDQGEQVEVLEAKRFNTGPAAQTWYKIAPPPGEFRWISGRFVDREPAEESRPPAGPENNLLIARHAQRSNEVERDDAPLAGATGDQGQVIEDDDDRMGDDFTRIESKPVGHEVRVAREQPREPPPGDVDHDGVASPDDRRELAAEHSRRWLGRQAAEGTQEELEELELALAAILAEEPGQWDFRRLRARADEALERAQTPLDRGRLLRYKRKLSTCTDLQRRHVAVIGRVDSAVQLAADVPHAAPPRDRGSRFDGVGRLTQVVARDARSPRFALLDERGQVTCYVTPTPGVNLRRYLNQEVGVNGTLGFVPEQGAAHVTARRVVSVDGSTLR